ncbi:MAG: hypothetical protein IJM76_01790 [Lachnospiraceae bacterium]|nr:hypothetical protein [Lachnospiraceae bacterium]
MKYGQYKIPTVFVVHPHRFAYQYDKEEDIRAVTVLISSFVNSLLYGFWHHRTIVEKASSADNCFESLLEKMMKRKVIEDYRLLSDYKTKEDVLTAYSENYFANMNASGGCVEQSLASGGYFWLFPARVIN